MKQFSFILPLILLSFVSCSRSDGYADYTPAMVVSRYFYVDRADTTGSITDSLACRYDETIGYYRLDTALVQDTVSFVMGLYGFANNLESFTMHWDTTSIRMLSISESMRNEVISSDLSGNDSVQYLFKSGFLAIVLPLTYIVVGEGSTVVDFCLSSASPYSPVRAKLMLPVASLPATTDPSDQDSSN